MNIRACFPFSQTWQEYPDTNSSAVAVYMTGCDINCPDCQNKDLANPEYRDGTRSFTVQAMLHEILGAAGRMITNRVVLMGGDPLSKWNIDFTRELLTMFPSYIKVCIYTGKSPEFVRENNIIGYTYIKTGRYDCTCHRDAKKTDTYLQLASPNQAFYDHTMTMVSSNGVFDFMSHAS